MADKKFQPKPALSKQEESALNKKIILGAVLTMVFLLLFMFTQFASNRVLEPREKPFEDLTPQEKLEFVQKSEKETQDDVNYQRAITLQNRLYCDIITDEKLKKNCISQTPELSEEQLNPPPQKPQEQIMDETNYQRAVTLRNAAYCDLVVDEQIKERCYADVTEME